MQKKINKNGVFCDFNGLSVVASFYEKNKDVCTRLYSSIAHNPKINSYFAALPPQSYHMTTLNLQTQNALHQSWDVFFTQKMGLLEEIQLRCLQDSFEPEVTVFGYLDEGVIQLLIKLPKEQVNKIKSIAHDLALQNQVPEVFHITLAYQYKAIPKEKKSIIKQEIKAMIESQISTLPFPMELSPPVLCSFNNMTSFTEWEVGSMPFKETQQDASDGKLLTFFSKLLGSSVSKLKQETTPSVPH